MLATIWQKNQPVCLFNAHSNLLKDYILWITHVISPRNGYRQFTLICSIHYWLHSTIVLRGKSVRSWCDESLDRSIMVDPLSYFLIQPVLHDWCNKGCGMCYPVCEMMHIKEPLLLIRKSSPCGGSRFPLSLYEWSVTICLTPYNRKKNLLSASLNKTFPIPVQQ